MVLVIYLIPGVAFSVQAAVALPLLLAHTKRPPEPNRSPGPPKLDIKFYLARVTCLCSRLLCYFFGQALDQIFGQKPIRKTVQNIMTPIKTF